MQALAQFGRYVNTDRAYIFVYDFERNECNNTYEWCEDGIEPQIQELQGVPLEAVPDWVQAHVKGDTIYIPDVFALPSDDGVRCLEHNLIPRVGDWISNEWRNTCNGVPARLTWFQ